MQTPKETTTEALDRLDRAIQHSRDIASGLHRCRPGCPLRWVEDDKRTEDAAKASDPFDGITDLKTNDPWDAS